MSVARLLNIPRTDRDLQEWTFANADSHNLIIAAIRSKYNQSLSAYVLDPLPQADMLTFLLRHQFAHDQFDAVLGIGGNDYTSLDMNDPTAVEYVWQQHANEHILAHTMLGI